MLTDVEKCSTYVFVIFLVGWMNEIMEGSNGFFLNKKFISEFINQKMQ